VEIGITVDLYHWQITQFQLLRITANSCGSPGLCVGAGCGSLTSPTMVCSGGLCGAALDESGS
jgi:hypothetical protein